MKQAAKLAKSIKSKHLQNLMDFSVVRPNFKFAYTFDLLDLNPCCSSVIGTSFKILFAIET